LVDSGYWLPRRVLWSGLDAKFGRVNVYVFINTF
jgi:hypothetical protein